MFDSAWQFVNLFAVLIFAAFLAKGLALSRFAYWLRRGTVACIFAASVYLSTLDNKTQQVHDTPPLFIQVYLYVFLLGFIVSWRVTPIGITGECRLSQCCHCKPAGFNSSFAGCRGNSLR